MTHYDVLGVAPDATAAEVRRAYLALARRHHPDVLASHPGAGDDAARMREVNQAWSVLGDPARRAAYDRVLAAAPADEARGFRPFDPVAVDPDPLELPDEPYRDDPGAGTVGRRAATLAPIALFGASVAAFAVGLVTAAPALLGAAVALFLLSCTGFLVVPLMALARATRDDG